MSKGVYRKFDTVSDLKFLENVVEMGLYGSFGDFQADSDFGVTQASANVTYDLGLPAGQLIAASAPLCGHFGLYARWHPDLPGRYNPDGFHQGLDGKAFLHYSARAKSHCGNRIFDAFTSREDQHFGASFELFDVLDRPAFHLKIKQQYVASRFF